jgi:uncharacterized SAM-dependent methyltransferase
MLTGTRVFRRVSEELAARARAEADLAALGRGPPERTRVTVTAVERALPAASKARTATVCTP